MKVAIGASRTIDKTNVLPFATKLLATLVPDETEVIFLLRRGRWTKPGFVEQTIWTYAPSSRKNARSEWRMPTPGPSLQGRGSVYVRDIEMIEEADLVLLFFTEGEEVDGYSGTAHLLDRALIANKPVFAYTVDGEGHVTWLGDARE